MNDLDLLQNQTLIPQERAQYIRQQFAEFEGAADNWKAKAESLVVTSEEQVGEMQMARAGRLAISKVRIAIDKTRKKLKENSLEEGRLIDGIAKTLTNLIAPIENHLKEQEEFAERAQARRIAEMVDRRSLALTAEGVDPAFYKLDEMTEEQFREILSGAKLAKAERIEKAKKEAEEAAAKAKAEAEERERQRVELERLRAENLVKEKALAEERAKAEAERKAAQDRERAQREAQDRKLAEERAIAEQKARLEREAAQKREAAERAAREKAEAELLAKKQQEEAEAKAKEEEARKLREGPEAERVELWIERMRATLDERPKVTSERLSVAMENLRENLEADLYHLEALCSV